MSNLTPEGLRTLLPGSDFIKYLLNNPSKLSLLPVTLRLRPYTMLNIAALCQVFDLVNELNQKGVAGALVEMGCWKGGAGAMMAYTDTRSGPRRAVWLFDSFEGLPEPTIEDEAKAQRKGWTIRGKSDTALRPVGVMKADTADVEKVTKALNVQERVHIIKGWFQNTVPLHKEEIGPIALLRIDADLYESTKYCFDTLYDSVSPGGIIILDDFDSFTGSRKATYEFFHERALSPRLRFAPFGGRPYFKK